MFAKYLFIVSFEFSEHNLNFWAEVKEINFVNIEKFPEITKKNCE